MKIKCLALLILLISTNLFSLEGKILGGGKFHSSPPEITLKNDENNYDHNDSDSNKITFDAQDLGQVVETTDHYIGSKLKPIQIAGVTYEERKPVTTVQKHIHHSDSELNDESDEHEKVKPAKKKSNRKLAKTTNDPSDNDAYSNNETTLVEEENNKKSSPLKSALRVIQISNNSIHVSGNIALVKHHSSVIDSAQYELDCEQLTNGNRSSVQSRLTFTEDFITSESVVKLYVSTSKTIDRKLAFSKFLVKVKRDHFPLSFHIHVKLPKQTYENDDITLYFFVYITNSKKRIDTFIPAGTSQILLQGTNRLEQKLDIYIKANGTEITGLFRGRYGQRLIQSETFFQVFIIPEENLAFRHNRTLNSVAQLTIKNVPNMYPVPFSLLVLNQILKSNGTYYAIAYITENGIQRSINQEPILIINQTKVSVTSQIIFNVIPSSLILHGTIKRSMPSSMILYPHSSLFLRLREVNSNSHEVSFKLANILALPLHFQVNISQAPGFDPSKNYETSASIIDEKNTTYMANLQPIPLLDDFSELIIPVDDLLYYVQVRLQSPSNQKLNYIPGSTARIFVTENPDLLINPIVAFHIDSISAHFNEFSFRIPVAAVQRDLNYYLVMIIDVNGIITHVSKSLLMSNKQPPPRIIQLSVPSVNTISGIIFDIENRPAQWSSSSYARLILVDDQANDLDHVIVQTWEINLEKEFPVRFEIEVDYSRIRRNHVYHLEGAIKNGRNILEYEPFASIPALNSNGRIMNNVQIPIRNIKKFQLIEGLIYMNDTNGPLPEKSEIILQVSSSSSLAFPNIIDETYLKVDGRHLPIDFTMKLPLNKIDINSIYYFLVRYIVRNNVIIPANHVFPFSPRNDTTVVLNLLKALQTSINGSVTSTDRSLMLPLDSSLHLYITNNSHHTNETIYSEVFLRTSSNGLYNFKMNIDSNILQRKIPLYLHADLLYEGQILISMPKPALLQITSDSEWNINLIVDLPTVLMGQIISTSEHKRIEGEFDIHIQIVEGNTTNIVHQTQLHVDANLPQDFRVVLDDELFVRYPALQARALIKTCKGKILFDTAGTVDIRKGFNFKMRLPVVLPDRKKVNELQTIVNDNATLHTGVWRLSVTGVITDTPNDVHNALEKKFTRTK